MSYPKTVSALFAFGLILAAIPSLSVAQEKVEGKVVHTTLTACNPRPEGGGCEGSLTLETTLQGKPHQIVFKVVAATLIRKGKEYVFLPTTQGNSVVITYLTEKGEKVAKLIEVGRTAR